MNAKRVPVKEIRLDAEDAFNAEVGIMSMLDTIDHIEGERLECPWREAIERLLRALRNTEEKLQF